MIPNLSNAHMALKQKREKEKERRLEDIYDYLEKHPGQTAYSLAKIKSLKLNKETARLSLLELERRGDIKLVEEVEKGLKKRKAYVKTLKEYYFTRFKAESLKIPQVYRLLEKSHKAGYEVTIVQNNGIEIVILPGDSLEEKLGLKLL